MQPKYDTDIQVTFTSKGMEFTRIIQGIKEGPKEPLYMIWVKDKWGWVKEGLIKEDA